VAEDKRLWNFGGEFLDGSSVPDGETNAQAIERLEREVLRLGQDLQIERKHSRMLADKIRRASFLLDRGTDGRG